MDKPRKKQKKELGLLRCGGKERRRLDSVRDIFIHNKVNEF
jgi:hypothetical protein